MTNGKRDYKKEYRKYGSRPEVKKQRARNNKANRKMGTYGNRDGKDVAHKDNNTRNNRKSNLSLQSKSRNRSVPRTSTGRRRKTKR